MKHVIQYGFRKTCQPCAAGKTDAHGCYRCNGRGFYYVARFVRDGVACLHPGCLSHVTHPCEVCGRFGGVSVAPVVAPVEVIPAVETQQLRLFR